MSLTFNTIAPITATVISIGGLIFQIGKHSEKLNVLGLEVQALEKKDEYSNKLLYDIHGKICKFEEKFNDMDDRFKNIEDDLKEIKNCVKCK